MRRILLISAVLGAAACKAIEIPVVVIPPGADVFKFKSTLLNYTFVDTTAGFDLHLLGLSAEPFAGFTCFGLSANSPTDTTGTFVFVSSGLNIGRMLRTDHGVQDTTALLFLRGDEGTHGTYAQTSTGLLKLFWSDGTQSRYFDPAAVIRISGDTIFSDVVRKSNADSVQDNWQVRWLRGACS